MEYPRYFTHLTSECWLCMDYIPGECLALGLSNIIIIYDIFLSTFLIILSTWLHNYMALQRPALKVRKQHVLQPFGLPKLTDWNL